MISSVEKDEMFKKAMELLEKEHRYSMQEQYCGELSFCDICIFIETYKNKVLKPSSKEESSDN